MTWILRLSDKDFDLVDKSLWDSGMRELRKRVMDASEEVPLDGMGREYPDQPCMYPIEQEIKSLKQVVTELRADMRGVHQTFRTNGLYAVELPKEGNK